MKKLLNLLVLVLALSACNIQFLNYPDGEAPSDLGLSWTTFENQYFSISYPIEWKVSVEEQNVIFQSPDAKQEIIAILQEDIPRPALTKDLTEKKYWGTLYHDKDAQTGEDSVDKLIADIPGSKVDFYLAGYGKIYNRMLQSLKIRQQDELIEVSVYFADQEAEFFSPLASREVTKQDKYWEILEFLLAGPNESEQEQGAVNLFDESVVLEDLKIDQSVAHIYFSGHLCNLPGAAFNVGMLINKTIKQFTEIEYVKIYIAGETQESTGLSDSIPLCLEP